MDRAAHHPKSDVLTEHQIEMERRRCAWIERRQLVQAGAFVPRDPLPRGQRELATQRHAREMKYAGIWLIARNAERVVRERIEARRRLRVLQGGRL